MHLSRGRGQPMSFGACVKGEGIEEKNVEGKEGKQIIEKGNVRYGRGKYP
jgi:hypothetical protein